MDRPRRIGLALLGSGPAEDRDKPGVDLDEVAWAEPVGFEGDAHLTQRAILADHVLLHRWRALIRAADGGTTSFDLWRALAAPLARISHGLGCIGVSERVKLVL
jgi:hypothetical protein